MKPTNLFALVLAGLLATGASSLNAQVTLHPSTLGGTIQFTNLNPSILSLLNPPGNEGMTQVYATAYSLPPAPWLSSASDFLPAASSTMASYQLTVDADAVGIAYQVTAEVYLEAGQWAYFSSPGTSAPVRIGAATADLNFSECVGVVTVQFSAGGAPATVDGGQIIAYDSLGNYSGLLAYGIPSGTNQQRIYLRGGETHRLDITVHRGTDHYTDRVEYFVSTNVAVACDEFVTVNLELPAAGALASAAGTVNLLREFPVTVSGNPGVDAPDLTSVIASQGPFSNQRWARLPGTNFTMPSSGSYSLTNLVPSSLDPASLGYTLYANLAFRTNRAIQTFRTPTLGFGQNPPLVVTPGASLDLSNLFVIDPGYLRGRILLQGPSEALGQKSLLRGILHPGDDTLNGIPAWLGTYGLYWTSVNASGADRLAPGATLTAAGGQAATDFDGGFDPVTSSFAATYELALGGLRGEASVWKQDVLALSLSSGTVTNDADYYYNVLEMVDQRTNDTTILPQQAATSDIAYCFGEVKLVYRTTAGVFYNPAVLSSVGSYVGTDFQGQPANYSVYVEPAYGVPNTPGTATNQGQVVMYLPQGSYTLQPSVQPGTSTYGLTGLLPIDVTVGCGGRILLEPCLQVTLNPTLATNATAVITGSVRSCTNSVTSLSWSLDAGPSQPICANCGQNPAFAFAVNLLGECIDHTLTVTATDDTGGTASVTIALHYDATPPLIQCPETIYAEACDTNGAAAAFTVNASDNCGGPVTVVCTPPSGSLFPLGTNAVLCTATDASGNVSHCTFNVVVAPAMIGIERAVLITWSCPGVLQAADKLTGPWTDIPGATSPYAVATSAARQFYRVRK